MWVLRGALFPPAPPGTYEGGITQNLAILATLTGGQVRH
jgi:hypothetical protein